MYAAQFYAMRALGWPVKLTSSQGSVTPQTYEEVVAFVDNADGVTILSVPEEHYEAGYPVEHLGVVGYMLEQYNESAVAWSDSDCFVVTKAELEGVAESERDGIVARLTYYYANDEEEDVADRAQRYDFHGMPGVLAEQPF